MKKINLLMIVFVLSVLSASGQNYVNSLYGFQLGQYREVAKNELGEPFQQNKYEDGYEYDLFSLKPDNSLYIVFEYAPWNTSTIYSIQISGSETDTDIGFKGLNFSQDEKYVERVLGDPDQIESIGEYGVSWFYKDANYSVEISTDGTLSSVKIMDNKADNSPDLTKLPKFDQVVKVLCSNDNAEIAEMLAPGLEIYYKDESLFFEKSIKTEIETDFSGIFQTIKKISKGLDKINTSDENVYEENMRLVSGQNPMHVIKIKSGHTIHEIVFDYINGQYLIWEISAQ